MPDGFDPTSDDAVDEFLNQAEVCTDRFLVTLTRPDGSTVTVDGDTLEESLVNLWLADQCSYPKDQN